MLPGPCRRSDVPDLRVIDSVPADKSVTDYLEHVAAKIAEGNVSAIAVAFVYRDGSTGSGYSEQPNSATMVGAVEALKAKLVGNMLE